MKSNRKFSSTHATRVNVPVLIGLYGPSGGGKTLSAIRLAAGIQRVVKGKVHVIDTESRRSLAYADDFDFEHVSFGEPYCPLDYMNAIEHCIADGAKTIIIDSMSHEHNSTGGVLEQHEAELDRMAGSDYKKRGKMSMLAWAKPKAKRQRLISRILRLEVNLIMCFRAKEKLEMVKGEDPRKLGLMPLGGDEFIYECTTTALLPAGCEGFPEWRPEYPGERLMVKIPKQFRDLLPGKQLSEDIGEAMARWAAGDAATTAPAGPYKFPKGEHAGKTVGDVPIGYLSKLLGMNSVAGKLRELVAAEYDSRESDNSSDGTMSDEEEREAFGDG